MIRTLMALVCLGWTMSGCGSGGAETPEDPSIKPTPGGTCVIGYFSDLDGLNEFTSTDANAAEVMQNMLYMPLLRWSADIELEGRLARSWEFSEDRRTITMQLRDDIHWHDGVPTTAEDVVFSFGRYQDPDMGYAGIGNLRRLESVDALGPYEVAFRFREPYANQLSDLRVVIEPKHLLEDVPSIEMESAEFNRSPVGNGPFRFVRWKRDQELVFEANPDFADGRPFLDRVIFRIIPDQTAIETAFRSRQLDVVERLRPEAVQPLRDDPKFQVFTYPQRGYGYIGWNTRHPFFQSARTRLAMTLAINRQQAVDALIFGEGLVTAHPVMSLSPYYAADIPPHPYDPERSRALLAEDGWSDTDGDGYLDRDGEKFEFTLTTNLGNQLREDLLVILQDDLKKVGVSVTPEVREWSVFLDDLKAKDFDACHLSWQTDFTLDPYDLFHSDAVEGKYNFTAFSDQRVDQLIEQGTVAATQEEAKAIWHDYQAVLHEQQPYTIMFEQAYSVGVANRVRGVVIDVRGMLDGIEDWWISPRDRKYAS